MLLWIDEHLIAFRRITRWHSAINPDKTSLFVYRVLGGFKLCRGDFDDAGFESYWIYPDMKRAVQVCMTWHGEGDAPDGWTHSEVAFKPGKRVRPGGRKKDEYVKDLPPKKKAKP